jgi:hypothetical protein
LVEIGGREPDGKSESVGFFEGSGERAWWFVALEESGFFKSETVGGELRVGSDLESGGESLETVLEDGLGCCREEGAEDEDNGEEA